MRRGEDRCWCKFKAQGRRLLGHWGTIGGPQQRCGSFRDDVGGLHRESRVSVQIRRDGECGRKKDTVGDKGLL